jgi:hypothetical protein
MKATACFAAALAILALNAEALSAPTPSVKDAWVRATIPGAAVSAVYFTVTVESTTPLKLVKAETPVAGIVELHDMKMKDGVMEMKAEKAFDLPAKGTLELKPGGKHVMLFKVKNPIKVGDKVPLTLTFQGADKKSQTVKVEAIAKAQEGGHH